MVEPFGSIEGKPEARHGSDSRPGNEREQTLAQSSSQVKKMPLPLDAERKGRRGRCERLTEPGCRWRDR
jgi:hypothetical protein